MRIGDRVVVLASENRGEIVGVQADGALLVQRDDLPPHFGPLPYDAHELEVVTTPQTEAAVFADTMAAFFARATYTRP